MRKNLYSVIRKRASIGKFSVMLRQRLLAYRSEYASQYIRFANAPCGRRVSSRYKSPLPCLAKSFLAASTFPLLNTGSRKWSAALAACLLLCAGCGAFAREAATQERPLRQTGSALPASEKKEAYSMLVRDEAYALSLYEPPSGCYLGAYILANKAVSFDIAEFEKLVEKPHGLYMFNMSLGDHFPTNWVLDCVANMKTPYVSLKTKAVMNGSDWEALEATAKSFGDFYVPMFVEWGPVDRSVPGDEYVETFRRARKLFAKHASNVAFVWSVDMADAFHCKDYYPGDEYTDWVGVQLIETLGSDKKHGDALNNLNAFYYTFQKQKPIIVSRLAVSHMSSEDYVYQTEAAAREIRRIYEALASDYSRVKAVIYMDFNGIEIGGKQELGDNFTVTGQDNILRGYNDATAASHFLNELAVASAGDLCEALYTSPFDAYDIGGAFYVSGESLRHDLGLDTPEAASQAGRTIGGAAYFPIEAVEGASERVLFQKKRFGLYS